VTAGHLGASAYWADVLDFVGGAPPPVDLPAERRLQTLLVAAIEAGVLASAHDCSDGGLAVALAEACMGAPYAEQTLGASLDLRRYADDLNPSALLFGEDHGRAVVSLPFEQRHALAALAREHGVPLFGAGQVTGPGTPLALQLGHRRVRWDVGSLRRVYFDAIPRRMQAVATSAGEGA
jgi:phosphoribosylformylglycinamidine synthase